MMRVPAVQWTLDNCPHHLLNYTVVMYMYNKINLKIQSLYLHQMYIVLFSYIMNSTKDILNLGLFEKEILHSRKFSFKVQI